MRKTITRLIALCSAAASIALAGCGSSGSGAPTSTATLSGVAATGAPIVGTVYIKDSSMPAKELSAPTSSDGSYSFNVEGMTPPFIVKVNWNSGTQTLMSFATAHGTANVTPLSNVIVANAAGVTDPTSLYAGFTPAVQQQMAASIVASTTSLQTRLKPLFDLYGVTANPLTGTFVANHTGLDAMLDAVSVTISSGNMVVTNKTTNATICTAPIQNMTSGTFTMGNMPTAGQVPPAATIDGAALYGTNCASCHGILASSSKKGRTAAQIQSAISTVGSMNFLSTLTAAQVQAIANALGTAAPAPAPAPTPAPTPMPTPTPTPTPTPVDGAALYTSNCASCHGPLATSSKIGITLARLQTAIASNTGGMGSLSSLTTTQQQAIVTALAPTMPTPTPTPAPTPTPTAPAAPASVTATGGANQVTISWPAVTGATSYNIYWATATGVTKTTGTKIAGGTSPYVQTGLTAGTAYYYVVTAVNSTGESAASIQAMATTSAAAPVFNALSFYNSDCLGCHGTLGPRTAAQITAAIANFGAMSQYRSTGSTPLTAAQISAIAAVSY
ncbi:c-type cytochrome [Geobacter sp. AOG1]|uniref:c-type cytochrome n=1 Tax=Geobacter sp. AOG1 TaxID=1566346 RepID=UPI001CC36A74|nr:fibronectin type III domain-containing protein [Geobacter sp. AOG1]GFE59028.1 hypothetical protein AOG1_29080 [Geobacter sp. AOG1]